MTRILIKLDSVAEFAQLLEALQRIPPATSPSLPQPLAPVQTPIEEITPQLPSEEPAPTQAPLPIETQAPAEDRSEDKKPMTGDRVIEMLDQGMSPKKIADALGIRVQTVNLIAYKLRKYEPNLRPVLSTEAAKPIIESKPEQAYKLFAEGKSSKEVAEALGAPINTAYTWMWRYNRQKKEAKSETAMHSPAMKLGEAYCQNKDCPDGGVFQKSHMVRRNGYLFCSDDCAADWTAKQGEDEALK